jgi:ubiquinone/menaquinone biosynthesis C-methylase UbiE
VKDPGHVKTFNRIAPRYDQKYEKTCGTAHLVVLDWARQAGLDPRGVLDIGCGTGKLLEAAGKTWPQADLCGIDPADGMLDIAHGRLPAARFHRGRAERLPLPARSVDLVLSTTSFGHWTDPVQGLREVCRVLRPGGSLLLVEHAPPGPLLAAMLVLTGRMPRLHDTARVHQLLEEAGMRAERVQEAPGGYVAAHARRPR